MCRSTIQEKSTHLSLIFLGYVAAALADALEKLEYDDYE